MICFSVEWARNFWDLNPQCFAVFFHHTWIELRVRNKLDFLSQDSNLVFKIAFILITNKFLSFSIFLYAEKECNLPKHIPTEKGLIDFAQRPLRKLSGLLPVPVNQNEKREPSNRNYMLATVFPAKFTPFLRAQFLSVCVLLCFVFILFLFSMHSGIFPSSSSIND